MTPQRIRPVGVVLSAIVLGAAALFLLVGAAGSAFTALMVGHLPPSALNTPGAPPPSPAMLTGTMLILALIELALAAWAIATLVGLIQMKPWARISVMIIGGCLVFLGVVSSVGTIAISFFANTVPLPPNANPTALHAMFLFIGFAWLVVATIGVWWLVYFALRRTRDAFTLATQPPSGYAPAYYPPPPSPYDPLDFSVAQPIPPPPPPEPEPTPIPYGYAPLFPPTVPKRPTSITVIAILLFISAFTMLIYSLLPVPSIMLGTIMRGWPAHVTNFVYAAISGIAGIGLIKLQKPAWFLTLGVYGFGALNTLISLLPGPRARMMAYSQSMTHSFSTGLPTYTPNPALASFFMNVGAIFSLLVWVLFFTLLWRARWAFEPAAAPPEYPTQP